MTIPTAPSWTCSKNGTSADQLLAVVPKHSIAATIESQPLPLVELGPLPRDSSLLYGIATVDDRGRVTDQTLFRALGWGPGDRIDITVSADVLVIRTSEEGVFKLTGKGHLHIPAAVRRWCDLDTGDRVLLAAAPDHRLMVVHSMVALDTMVIEYHASAFEDAKT